MRARKDWLKRLAAERRAAWMIAVRPRSLDGETRIHTRNEVLQLEDGVVITVLSGVTESYVDASPLIGMRVVGWAGDDNRLHAEFIPGTRAILWRRPSDGDHTSVGLTGRVIAFAVVQRAVTGSLTLPAPRSTAAPAAQSRRGDISSDARQRSGIRIASRA